MRAYLLHGFNVWDGGLASVGRLATPLGEMGLRTHPLRYGWSGLLSVRLFNGELAQTIADMMDPGDVFIAHSNGCDLVRRISFMDVPQFNAVLINPALNTNTQFGKALGRALVMHNQEDWAVWFARWLLFHPWGAMGRWGYSGDDSRISNYDCWPIARGHSGLFKHPQYWVPLIHSFLTESD